LSVNEAAALDIINKHPGLTPHEIGVHLKPLNIAPSSASAITSRLIWLKRVNRVKVPMSPSYRYYPQNHPLPNGYAMWNNTLVRVNRTKKDKGNGEQVTDGKRIDARTRDLFNAAEDARIEQKLKDTRSDKVSLRSNDDVLITIPTGERESLTVNIEQARKIWAQLNAIFGERA
jgi:hypothetical protein